MGESHVRPLLLLCVLTFGCYFATFIRLPVVPLYAKSLGIDAGRIGLINSAFFLMAACLSLPLGLLSDHWGRKRLAGAGILILAIAAFSLSVCKTFPSLTAAYLLFGAGTAAFGPTMMAFAAHISPVTHLGRSYGWYTTAIFCGMSLGPAVGGFLAVKLGFIPVFWIAGTALLITLAVFQWQLPADEVSIKAKKPDLSFNLTDLIQNRSLMGCWTITLGGCFGLGMFISFTPLHAQDQGLSVDRIGMVFFVQGLCNALSRIPFGRLSDRVADRSVLVTAGVVAMMIAMIGFGASRTALQFMFFAMILGAAMGLAFTSIGALTAQSVEPALRGMAMGGYNTCIYAGMMISSAIMGSACERIGFVKGFFAAAGVLMAFLSAFLWFLKRGPMMKKIARPEK